MPGDVTNRLKRIGQRQGSTLFMVLLGAFQILLGRYAGQDDLAVGSPIANRNRREIEDLIGFFANSLVMRTDLSGNPTFEALLVRVRDVTLGAYANQDVPFEMLVEHLQPARHLGHNPLFQVVFALQNAPLAPFALHGLDLQPLELDNETTRFDLELHLWERPEGLSGYFVYNTALFDDATIRRLSGHFSLLLAEIADHPERPIDELLSDRGAPLIPDLSLKLESTLVVEVEAALRDHPLVDDCAVLLRETDASGRAVVAYVVWTGGGGLSTDLFPMLPAPLLALDLVPIASMPRTASGDIDEAALLRLEVTDIALTTAVERVAPETALERTIAAIWAEALQTEVVSTSDNFFELGGHSILLAQIHGKLCVALDHPELSIVDLFRYPTIRALAAHLSHRQVEKPTYETFQDRAAKQRVALQRQRQFRRQR